MTSVNKNGLLSRRSVCGSGLSAAALMLTGCGGGGGGSDSSGGGSSGPINGGLTGTLYYSFTDNLSIVDLATGNTSEITKKLAGTPPRYPFVYGADYFELSADSKTLFYIDGGVTTGVVAVDIASNTANKTPFKMTQANYWREIRLSPDGKYFAMVKEFDDGKGVNIFDRSGNRIGYSEKTEDASNSVCWTPDNRLLFSDDGIYLTDPGSLARASPISTVTPTSLSVSPAGDKIAYASFKHIWIMDINGGNAVQVTTGDNIEFQPRWSPDGKYIIFQGYTKGTNAAGGGAFLSEVYYLAVIPADGKQYTLNATGPDGSGGGTFTGIAAGPGVILLQGQNLTLESRPLGKIAAQDMIWR
jgi:hypothetical protein